MLKSTRLFVVTGTMALAGLFAFPDDSEAGRRRGRCCRARQCHSQCNVGCQPRVSQGCGHVAHGCSGDYSAGPRRLGDGYGSREYRPDMDSGYESGYDDGYYRDGDNYGW